MQIASRENLHEISNPIFERKIRKHIVNLSSAGIVQRMVKVSNVLDEGASY